MMRELSREWWGPAATATEAVVVGPKRRGGVRRCDWVGVKLWSLEAFGPLQTRYVCRRIVDDGGAPLSV